MVVSSGQVKVSVRVAAGGKPKSMYQTLSFTHLKGESTHDWIKGR